MKFSLALLAFFVSAHVVCAKQHPEVQIKQGKLQGLELKSRKGNIYHGFMGIPYAKPPKRFEVAEPPTPWEGTRDATKFGSFCAQLEFGKANVIGSEDCLFVNVFTPVLKVDSKDKLPVMVWIHGGAFFFGMSDQYEAMYLMDEPVVVVTLNYRLTTLGFLSTGDGEIQGNYGLKDQAQALKWVKDNIENFGGDPNKVTLFGNSAGSASIDYHSISPMSAGLFHRAISVSGSALSKWALQRDPLKNAKIVGEKLNCPVDSTKALADCLRNADVNALIGSLHYFIKWFMFPLVTFAPVVENGKAPIFLSDTPYSFISQGKLENKVPYMQGFLQDEAVIFNTPMILNKNFTNDLNERWNQIAPDMLDYDDLVPEGYSKDEISKRIREFYFEEEAIGESSWSSLTEMLSDRHFFRPINDVARFHSKHSKVYPFVFSFPGDHSNTFSFFGIPGQFGVAHTDELQYLFNATHGAKTYESDSEIGEFSEKLIKLWVSFAQSGKPSALWGKAKQWKPISPSQKQIKYYQIDIDTSTWEGEDFDSRFSFWDNLPLKEGKYEKYDFPRDEL